MTSPSTTITNLTPASGLSIRRPRCEVWIDDRKLLHVLEVTITRGLEVPLATAEISYPHPLPDYVRYWSEVKIIAGTDNFVRRFTGYVTGLGLSLWPGAKTIRCQDVMAIAANTYAPEEVDLGDRTDQDAVREVLFGCNYAEGRFRTINGDTPGSGTGVLLSDVEEARLFWELGETGLERIQSIDEVSLGWRTYATASGDIVRKQINTNPNAEQIVHHFGEGVDILDGSQDLEILDAKNEITVTGFDGTATVSLDEDDDPFHWSRNSYWIRYQFLRTQARREGYIHAEDVAEYIISQIGKRILKVTFSTHLDTLFQGQEVIKLTSEHLEVDQQFWVQSVQLTVQPDGTWTQTLTGVSELEPYNRHMVVPPIDIPELELVQPGDDVTPIPIDPVVPPTENDILVDFAITGIDKESAAPAEDAGSSGGVYYIVTAEDASTSVQGTIASQEWTAAGPGVRITSGSGPTFTTAFTDLAGAEITLTVTDSNGSSASLTKTPEDIATVRARTLFACTDEEMYASDGSTWRKQAPTSASTVQCVANGPMWGCGQFIAVSEDYLATPAAEYSAFGSGSVSSIWISESNSLFAAAGTEDGQVAVSRDRGVTWEARTSPGSAVKFIIVSIHDTSELHVVTPEGWFKSQDEGQSWDVVREGDFTYLELSHSRNIIVTAAGALEKAEDGTPFTGITGTVVAATAHIRKDQFYALTDDGNTWVSESDGSFAMVAGEPIPAGAPYHAGTYRDGLLVDLVFFAAQEGGLFKTLDGFRTANGYLRILDVGELTP